MHKWDTCEINQNVKMRYGCIIQISHRRHAVIKNLRVTRSVGAVAFTAFFSWLDILTVTKHTLCVCGKYEQLQKHIQKKWWSLTRGESQNWFLWIISTILPLLVNTAAVITSVSLGVSCLLTLFISFRAEDKPNEFNTSGMLAILSVAHQYLCRMNPF